MSILSRFIEIVCCAQGSPRAYHISRVHRESVAPTGSNSAAAVGTDLNTDVVGLHSLPALKKNVRVLKHIPKGARNLAAGKLCTLIDACVRNNGVDDWFALLSFSFTALRVPGGGAGKSLTSKVKENIDSLNIYFPDELNQRPRSVYRAIEAKVHDGDLRGAVRILLSDSSLAPSNADNLRALRDKHPSPSRQLVYPPEPDL